MNLSPDLGEGEGVGGTRRQTLVEWIPTNFPDYPLPTFFSPTHGALIHNIGVVGTKAAANASTCVIVLANGAEAADTHIWGHVLVLAISQRLARTQLHQLSKAWFFIIENRFSKTKQLVS